MCTNNCDISNQELLCQLVNLIKEEGAKNKEELKQEIIKENEKILDVIGLLKTNIQKIENNQQNLEERCKKLEKNLRKNNILIFGLNKPDSIPLPKYVIDNLSQLLDIDINERDINNLYQLRNVKIPTIKVEFVTYLKKLSVLKNCYKLKGKQIFIAHDLSPEEREDHKILTAHKKLAKSKELNVKIIRNTLKINDEIYTVDQLRKLDTETSSPVRPPPRSSISAPATPRQNNTESDEVHSDILPQSIQESTTNTSHVEIPKLAIKTPNTPSVNKILKQEEKKRTNSVSANPKVLRSAAQKPK